MAETQILEGTSEELIRHLIEYPGDRFRLIKLPEDRGYESFEEAFANAINRTPEEIAAARARAIAASPPPREIPQGKTVAEVVMGQWPGDETDEQILEALEKLS